jgi:hypothetical protein
MRNLYAMLLTAMSLEEAKATLGFPPDAAPSPAEINKAWRAKAFENHPDRGGSNDKMVEVNVAKDILEGKEKPTYDRSPSGYSATPAPYAYSPPDESKDNVVTFDEAKSKAGIPGNTEWLFVTTTQREKNNYSGDESSKSFTAFVAYGQTDSKHVFAAASNTYYQAYFVGGGPKTDAWEMASIEFPKRTGEKIDPAWLYSNVVKALKKVHYSGKFNSKVLNIKGHKLDSDLPTKGRTALSIKHIMVELGLVESDDASVAGRKQVVEAEYDRDMLIGGRDPKPHYYKLPGRYDAEKITLIINGKEYPLSEKDLEKFFARDWLHVVWGQYPSGKKTLTRLRNGKYLLNWLAENMRDLPPNAAESLQAASNQMK